MSGFKNSLNVMYITDAILLAVYIAVRFKLMGSFVYPDDADFVEFLQRLQTVFCVAFIVAGAATVAMRKALKEISEEVFFLNERISEIEKKIEQTK